MISFQVPAFLWAIPLGAAVLLLLFQRSRSNLSRWRHRCALLTRFFIVALLLTAMARPSQTSLVEPKRVAVFLLDVSESVSEEALAEAILRVEALSRVASANGSWSSLILFAGEAEVLIPPSRDPLTIPRDRVFSQNVEGASGRRGSLAPTRTDFGRALRLAETIAGAGGRYVIVTDGLDPLASLPPNRMRNLRLLTLGKPKRDVAVVGIRAPLAIRTGEPFDARVDLFSSEEGEVEIWLRLADRRVGGKRLKVPRGRSVVVLRNIQATIPHGSHQLVALASADGDREPRNNMAAAPLLVLGKPHVLVVEDTPASGDSLVRMLRTHDFEIHRIPPSRVRSETLAEFDTIVAVGLRGEDFDEETSRRIRDFVVDGGGFWLVARPDPSAGASYAKSPIADLLPVVFEPVPVKTDTGEKETPKKRVEKSPETERSPSATVALLLVVDKSGSMAGKKLDLVKEACRVTADTLTAADTIGVLAFDAKPRWVLEFVSPVRKEYIRDRLYRLLADGGTDIFPALLEAFRAMTSHPRARRAGIRHVVLLSDGDTREADFHGLVSRMAKAGITVSTVCILRGKFDPILMNEIANLGKGRFKSTGSFSNIPKIFTDEAKTLVRNARPSKEEESGVSEVPVKTKTEPVKSSSGTGVIHPKILEEHEILWAKMPRDLPALKGMLPSTPRPGVRTPIGTAEGKSILSIWRTGLGKAAVWTSDLSGKWSSEWLRWDPQAPKLFAHLIRHLSSAAVDLDLASRVEIQTDRRTGRIQIEPGEPNETISITRLQPTRRPLPLRFTNDGGRVAELALTDEPTIVRLTKEAQGRTENLTLTLLRPYEDEFLPTNPLPGDRTEDIRGLLTQTIRGDREETSLVLWFLLAALCILPLDVALRRWA